MLRLGVAGLRGLPGVMGGVETHCEELYPRLRRRPEHRVLCIARRPYVSMSASYQHAGVNVRPLPSTRSAAVEALLNTFLAVLYFGVRRRPDVLQIHAIGPAVLTPLAKLFGLKVVVTHHGRDYRRAKWSRGGRFALRLGERFALRWADAVIAVSGSLADELRREFPDAARRVVHIPNGVPLTPLEPSGSDPLARFGLQPDDYVLSVGRLVPEKGFQDLIAAHAAAGLRRKLVIAGGADHDSPFIRKLMDEAGPDVIFTGRLSRAELRRLYDNAALFVLASHHEGMPIVALEAAASGRPMLLSGIDANRDVGLDPVNYFPVGDVAALADRLKQPWSRFGVDGRAVCARFDWDAVCERTAAVFSAVRDGAPLAAPEAVR